jgi:4-diphosphocytidyl-2-C-methyl-D-erythritol kinase
MLRNNIGKQKEKDRCRRKGAERMRLQAFAKINLGLDVLGKREDGYHEVRMIMQTIRMYDQLDMRKSVEPGIHLTTNKKYIPVDENNLVWRAAKLMMDTCGIMEGVSIHLHKVIPVAAGMAGGSSDAAATLVGMNRLFHCGLSKEKLMELGVQIGADVPYCVLRGTALAEGIGEKLTVLPPMPDCWILIGKPGISVSTKYVYTTLDLNTDTVHPDIDGMKKALEDGNLYGITERMGNVLQDVTIPAYPEVERIKEQMKTLGAVNAMMSGSGPTVFGIFDNEEKAQEACQKLRESGSCQQVFLTVPFNNYGGKTIDGE